MPKLQEAPSDRAAKIEFVVSVPLDLLNAMYFTHLADEADGIDEWPAQVRGEMDPALLAELDFLYTYPRGQPGIMGTLGDSLFTHREKWRDVDGLLRYVREMPAGVGEPPQKPGIQGLTLYGICSPFTDVEVDPAAPPRERLSQALKMAGSDAEAALTLYDQPEKLRERMVQLIKRFYDEHYRHDLPRRQPCLERSAAAHKNEAPADIAEFTRALIKRPEPCLEEDPSRYSEFIFTPSMDMGPYVSCIDLPPLHGLFYACEPEFMGERPEEAENTQRLARIHKALGDEQRLRILNMLREREMYAQEIVDRTGLHQSVVSRHLMFMKAVGLLSARREGNMKFFSLNPEMQDELRKTMEIFEAGVPD